MPSKKRLDVLMQNIMDGNILDAGCGTGWATLCLLVQGHTPLLIDLSKDALKDCTHIVKELGYGDKRKFIRASVTNFPFPDSSFKTIFSFDVLEHVTNLDRVLLELRRVLDNDGKLIVTVPNGFGSYSILKDYVIKPIALRLLVPKQERTRYLHVHLHGLKWWTRKHPSGANQLLAMAKPWVIPI